jgi:hypothetical protein
VTTEQREEKEKELLLAQKRTKNEIALRRRDAQKMGELLVKIGSMLIARPEGFFAGIGSAIPLGFDIRDVTDFNEVEVRDVLSYDNVVRVTNEVRQAVHELERIEEVLQTF